MSEKNDDEDGGDYGNDFENQDDVNDNDQDNQNNDKDDKKDPQDDENNQEDLLEEEPLEEYNDKYAINFINSQEQTKLNLTIGDTNGMDENEQLKKWKKQAEYMSEAIKELRAKNNLYRNKLKKLGDKAEKLVQSNVRRQKNTELKQADKHSYLNEQKIVLEIMKNNKSPAEFKEYLDQRIIESLVKVYKEKQSNDDLKAKIHQIKDKNRNIDFNDQITELTNQLTAMKAQLDTEKKNETKLKEITKKQEIEIQQMTQNFDYQSKKEELQNEIKKMKDEIRQMQVVELNNQKRYREQNDVYVDLQKRYRQTCQMANKQCDDTKLVSKQGEQENSNKTLQQQIYMENHEKIQKIKSLKEEYLQKEREKKKDDKLKDDIALLEEYRANKDLFKTRVESVEKKNVELEKKNKEFIEKKKKLNEEIIRLSEEAFELDKQCRKKEQDAKVVVRKLNEAQRKLNVTDKKPIIEEAISQIYQKPVFQQYGQLNKSETALPFDDSKNLDWSYNALKISRIMVYLNKQDLIQGIEIKYDQQDIEEKENKGKQNKHLATTVSETTDKKTFEIEKDDLLSYVSGFYNQEQIIFLKFETQKKKSIQVGNIKYKDAQTKDFRIEIKDTQNILGFTGILDYTSESKTPNERFLVAIGLQIKNKEQNILEKKRIKKLDKLDKQEKSKQVQIRRGQYILKKHKNDNLSLVNKSVQQLNSSSSDRDYKLIREDKIRLERVKLGLNSAKLFSPTTYKASEYKIEEEKRRELSEKRRVEIEKFRLQTQSAKALPAIQTDQNKGQSDKKGNASQIKDKAKTVPKKK